jgi:hypothetical protein
MITQQKDKNSFSIGLMCTEVWQHTVGEIGSGLDYTSFQMHPLWFFIPHYCFLYLFIYLLIVDLNMLSVIKLSQGCYPVRWLKADETNVLRTISVLVLMELKWPGIQSVLYIYLPGPSAHCCMLASREWWVESTACSAWPCFLIM